MQPCEPAHGQLYCAHCGAAYYRRESRDKLGNVNSRWVCSGKINNGSDSCPSFAVYEDEIKPLLFEVFRDTHDASEEMILEYERMYAAMTSDVNLEGQISDAEGKIELALKNKSKLLELTALGQITNEDFAAMTAAQRGYRSLSRNRRAQKSRDDSGGFGGTWRRYAPPSVPRNARRTRAR
ncbi:MAG: recombinase zinc beta ribbon domain-containing protein [Oscillospiraceae bacterium]